MSISRFFYEPFFSVADFDRLFDEALSTRAPGNLLVQRPADRSPKYLRPR
jgi:HSP20 family protein